MDIWHLPRRVLLPLAWVLLVVTVCALGLPPAAQAQSPAAPAAAAPHPARGR